MVRDLGRAELGKFVFTASWLGSESPQGVLGCVHWGVSLPTFTPLPLTAHLILGGQMFAQGKAVLIKPQGYLCHVTVDWPSLGSREEAATPNPNHGGWEEAVPAVWSLRLPSFLFPGPYTNRLSSLPA